MRIFAGFVFLAFSLSFVVGCSRGKGGAPQSPPTAPATPPVDLKPTTQEPDPEPEPVPGEMVRLSLPRDGGAWPWTVGKADEPPASRPATLKGVGLFSITGFAVRPEVNRAVVTIRNDPPPPPKKGAVDPKKGPPPESTRVAVIDTATGEAIASQNWNVPGSYAALDLSPDRRSILATHPLSGKERGILRLWVIAPDGQLKRWPCTAHSLPRDGIREDLGTKPDAASGTEVRWAAFVGDRVVSMSRAGQLRVFDTEGLKPLATIDATPCRPAITPDGTKVAFLIGTSVALLDPTARKITGTRWIGTPPQHPVLAFSPDGTKLAIGGNGRALVMNLTSGQFQNLTLPKMDVNDNGLYDKPFVWAGASHLLADGLLFDPQLPQPVWEYSASPYLKFRGWRVWACLRAPDNSGSVLQAHELPSLAVLGSIATAKGRTGAFGLQPGGGVKIDVSGLPEERRSESTSVLEQRLREAGFVPDPNAAATLFASVDSPGTKPTVVYSGLGSYSYTKKAARLRLVLNDKELWSDAWAVEPPFALDLPKGTLLADHLTKLGIGLPDYKAFALAPLPSHLPGPGAPSRSARRHRPRHQSRSRLADVVGDRVVRLCITIQIYPPRGPSDVSLVLPLCSG